MAWYGSVNNRIMERAKGDKPEVGMGVTHCGWSDRDPYEIIEVIDDRHIKVRELGYKLIDGSWQSEHQEYEYISNPNGTVYTLFKNQKGRWVRRVGARGVDNYGGWYIGKAEKYYDPCF